MQIPRILITAPASGGGKTLFTCGILRALKNRTYKAASFKCGPDYIDPMFHRTVLGVDSYNLDTFLCGKDGVREILIRHGSDCEISVLEGVMGYYDGLAGISDQASTYEVAAVTETPAILIVDCKGRSESVIPEIQGFLHYKENSQIKGVLLNRLSPMMYDRMKTLVEEQTGIPVYGYLPVMPDCILESRYLGLRLPQELEEIDEQLRILGEQIEKSVDVEGLLALARSAPELCADHSPEMETEEPVEEGKKLLRIGVAKDEAFCFIYPDNLEVLERLGAELIYFSPLHDAHIPEDLDGMILYGGYPELYAAGLSRNEEMLTSVRTAIQGGLPCIAECGGYMYLMEAMEDGDGNTYPMVGVIPGKSYKTSSLRRFGYITLRGGTVFGQDVGDIPAHEFHYYDAEECGDAFEAKKPLSDRAWRCMVNTENLFAGYPHICYLGNKKVAQSFLDRCRK
jgi:cobyrinic acid a,c-diamide synthase